MAPNLCYWLNGKQYWVDNSGNTLAIFDPINGNWDFSAMAAYNVNSVHQTSRFKYDFAVNGGVYTAAINFTGQKLPAKAVVTSGAMYVKTALVGGTNASIQLVGANDIITAAATSGAPWSSATTLKEIIPVGGTASTWVTVVTASVPQLLVTASNLTAGVIILVLNWFQIE